MNEFRQSDFSYAEVKEVSFLFNEDTVAESVTCIGSSELELETRTITKKCGVKVQKSRTKATGNGTDKLNIRIPWDLYVTMFAMDQEGLEEGVTAYGEESLHPTFTYCKRTLDEDGEEMLIAHPNATIKSNQTVKIDNSAEDIAAVDLEIAIMPDEYGNGTYQTVVKDLPEGSQIAKTWMTNFTPELVQKSA